MLQKAPELLTFIIVILSKSILGLYQAEVVWRRVAVNRPPYGCAKAEGKSAFCFLKTYFGSGLAHQAGKKVDDEIDNAKFEREFKRVVSALRADDGGVGKPGAGSTPFQ